MWRSGNAVHSVSVISVILTDVSVSRIYQSKHHRVMRPLRHLQPAGIRAHTSNTVRLLPDGLTLSLNKIHILTLTHSSKAVHFKSGVIERWSRSWTLHNTQGYISDFSPKVTSVLMRGKLRGFRVWFRSCFAAWAHRSDDAKLPACSVKPVMGLN